MVEKINGVEFKKYSPMLKGACIGALAGASVSGAIGAKFLSDIKPMSKDSFTETLLNNKLHSREFWKREEFIKEAAKILESIESEYKNYLHNSKEFNLKALKVTPKMGLIFTAMTTAVGLGVGAIFKAVRKDK